MSQVEEIEVRECIQGWVKRKYTLEEPMDPEQFFASYNDRNIDPKIKTKESVWEKETLRVIAVETPEEIVEVESNFDWSLPDYSDQQELFNKVVRRMQRGICQFSFEMVSSPGVKIAFGTLAKRVLPADKIGSPINVSNALSIPQVYWDLEAQDWRSFLPTHLITTV